MFVKAHIQFVLDGHQMEFIHQNASLFGVTGLPWSPLHPTHHFGKNILLTLKPQTPEHAVFKFQGSTLRERSSLKDFMGIKFRMDAEQRSRFEALLKKHGKPPSATQRKIPRIPSVLNIPTFPLRSIGILQANPPMRINPNPPIVFDVGDLSPQGILLSTENPMAAEIHPGKTLEIMIEPRGTFPTQIHGQGLVCRTIDELNWETGNVIRYFGIRFLPFAGANKTAFNRLLKDIVGKMTRSA